MAQVTTADIRTRIKNMIESDSVIAAISNIHVKDVAPMALARGILPAVIITDGNGTYDHTSMGNRYVKSSANYTISLYAQEWNADPQAFINAGVVDSFTTALEDLMTKNHPMIYNGESLKGVRDAKLTSFTQVAPRSYPVNTQGQTYVHKSWQYQVT